MLNSAVTTQAAVIGPVVYGLVVLGVPPQPEIDTMNAPAPGVTVQVVLLPSVTGLAHTTLPLPALTLPDTANVLSTKVPVTVHADVIAPEVYGLVLAGTPPQPLIVDSA